MSSLVRALSFLVCAPLVQTQFDCPTNYAFKDGTCSGAASSSCNAATCCSITGEMCSSKNAITGDLECKKDSAKYFYDLGKTGNVYASGGFKSSCCTACSAATCGDWKIAKLLVGCPSGQMLKDTNALGSNDCSIPSDADYKSKCCVAAPSVCSSKGAILGDVECKSNSDKSFYDLKKGAQTYTSNGFKSACCTSCSQATCADWGIVKALVGCPSGKAILGTKSLGSSDCSIPSNDDYKSSCCVDLMTCAKAETVSGAFKLEGMLPWWVLVVSAIIRK